MLCACSSSSRNLLSPGFWDIRCNRQSFLGHFLPFDPHNNPKYQNFEKMNMINMNMVIRCMVPEILSVTHNCLPFLGYFLPFYPTNNLKNQNFEKMGKKNAWRYHHFTLLYHKWQSYDVWFLRYGAGQTHFFFILNYFLPF